MAETGSLSTPVWRLDRQLTTKGDSVLHGVRAVSADEVWAVGTTVDPGSGHSRALVGRWNHDFQFVRPAEADPDVDVLLAGVDGAGDDVWAVGQVSGSVNGVRTRIERYQRNPVGGPGQTVVSPSVDHDCALRGLVMLSITDGWAVGGSGPGAGEDFTRTFIIHWDGTTWTTSPSPSPGTMNNQLDGVAANAADDVWAVGRSRSKETGGQSEALVLHWDGSIWSQVPVPRSAEGGDELLGVAVAGPDSVWVVGRSVPGPTAGKDALPAALALHWNGSTWQAFRPQGLTQFSGVSVKSENEVWFAGYAELPGGLETPHIERWDGRQLRSAGPDFATNGNVASALDAITAETGHMAAVGWRISRGSPTPQPAVFLATS